MTGEVPLRFPPEADSALRELGLVPPYEVRDLGGWVGRNLRVSREGRSVVLKRLDPGSPLAFPPARLRFRRELSERLEREGFPTPRYLARVSSDDSGSDGSAWEIYEFVEGRSFDPGNRAQLSGVGVALAAFHELAARLTPPADDPWGAPGVVGRGLDRLARRCREAGLRAAGPDVESRIAEVQERFQAAASRLDRGSVEAPIHGDVHPGNVLFAGDDVRALFDFDFVRAGRRIWDIALALMKFAAPNVRVAHFASAAPPVRPLRLDVGRASALLASYSSRSPLATAELEALPDQLVATFVERRCWLVEHLRPESADRVLDELHGSLAPLREGAVEAVSALG